MPGINALILSFNVITNSVFILLAITVVYRNIWLGNTYYNFCYSANILNMRSRGFDHLQYYIA